jgi:hypothetical protein
MHFNAPALRFTIPALTAGALASVTTTATTTTTTTTLVGGSEFARA